MEKDAWSSNWAWNSETNQWDKTDAEEGQDEDQKRDEERSSETNWWEQRLQSDGHAGERMDAEEVLMTVQEDDAESICTERHAPSVASTSVDGDRTLESFLARVGPDFDAAFVAKHSGAENYDDLIKLTFTRTDLDPLVQAGMKPLRCNKLFKAIQKEQASCDAK